MNHRERALDAFFGLPPPRVHGPRVVYERVESVVVGLELPCQPVDLGLRGEIRDHKLDRLVAGSGPDLGRSDLAFAPVAPDNDDPGAQVRKIFGGRLAYPAGPAGNEHHLAIHNFVACAHVTPPCSSDCLPVPRWRRVGASCPARR